jgi:hypothetical protein
MTAYSYLDYEPQAEDNQAAGSALITRFPEGWNGNRVNGALAALASAVRNLGDLATRVPDDDDDDTTPLGTMSLQNASNVSITGGILGAVRGASPVGALVFWWGNFAAYTANYNTLLSFGWVIADGRTVTNPFTGGSVTAPNFLGRYPKFGSSALALSGAATQTTAPGGSHTHTISGTGTHNHAIGTTTLTDAHIPTGVLYDITPATSTGSTFGVGEFATALFTKIRSGLGQGHTHTIDSGGLGGAHNHTISAGSDHTHTVTMAPPTIELIPLARIF